MQPALISRNQLITTLALSVTIAAIPGEGSATTVIWPTTNRVVREFAPPWPDWLPGHRGLDITATAATLVQTPHAGTLVWKGRAGGVPTVVISHGAARASYQPVQTDLVVNDQVRRTDSIGRLANSFEHCEKCLHWGLRIGPQYLDPRLLLGQPSARLVPPPTPS
jgi:murein DD-endopeptidase MepM/ murein hydrolase activator NlpD